MKILTILQCTNLGGMEHSALMRMTRLSGYEHALISVHPFGGLKAKLDKLGIPSEDCSYAGPLGLYSHFSLRRKIREISADSIVFMVGPTITGILALPITKLRKRFLFVHYHHKGVHGRLAWKILYLLAVGRFDHIFFCSEFIRNEAIGICEGVEGVSSVLRNVRELPAIPSSSDKAMSREKLGIPQDSFVVSNAGWLIQRKRFDVFIEVARRVCQVSESAKFVIAGDGELRGELERLAKGYGLSDRVVFVGWITDVSDLYKASDCILFNTDADALGMTVIEGMSYALPVAASAVYSGISEVLTNREGVCLGKHDPDELAAHILKWESDSELRRSLARNARHKAEFITSDEVAINPILERMA